MFKRESKQILKTMCVAVLSLAIILVEVASVQAAPTAYMKKMNVKWDLKPGKTVTYKTKWAGVGMKTGKATIKNYKVSDAEEGYKEMKFTVVFKTAYKPSKSEIHKIVRSMKNNSIGFYNYYAVIDYMTGKSLEAKNDADVKVTNSDFKYPNTKYYYDSDGCYVGFSKTVKISVTITYPDTYENLCIAVGGSTALVEKDKKFWNGKTTFSKTKLYSKSDKSVCHCMRVK